MNKPDARTPSPLLISLEDDLNLSYMRNSKKVVWNPLPVGLMRGRVFERHNRKHESRCHVLYHTRLDPRYDNIDLGLEQRVNTPPARRTQCPMEG